MTSAPRALVTGGGGNLGRAVAQALLDRGYEVHVTALNEAERAALAGTPIGARVEIHVADLARERDTIRLFEDIGPPLAAVVGTVGGFTAGPFASVNEALLDQQYALNLKSAVLTLRHAHTALRSNSGGAAAVLVANRPALLGGAGVALTSAVKAGIVSLVRSVADEWREDGIAVNAVAPGVMDTPQNRRAMPGVDPARWPTPEQVAAVIAFLVSPDARIISGATLPVFGRS